LITVWVHEDILLFFVSVFGCMDDGVGDHTLAVSLSQPENSWTREKGMVNSLFSKYVPPLWMSMP
jgi:hypothetical protein